MSAYIPLIKETSWIDLSIEHKKLRQELEDDLKHACVEKAHVQPIMLQGSFGIGKTNSLYYLFHYGWCVLNTPTFFISLDNLTQYLRVFADQQPSGKINNSEIGPCINEILNGQIESLKTRDWSNVPDIFLPEYKGGDLQKYLQGFSQVEIIEESQKESIAFSDLFSEKVIKQAITSGNRPILLIDEFESKFYELKKIIETSGGGVLRELFDQIVQDSEMFYLIIGNGPASGYEIAKERGDEYADSETAANRRLKTKSIPFPTANLLKRSFLKHDPKGYINFIWWLSRCRPGHILKLRDNLRSFKEISILNTNELITKPIFREAIDDGGEAVTYLKTGFFNEIPGRVQAAMLKELLISFEPQEFDIKDYKNDLKDCVPYFYCASNMINSEIDLLSVLREDFYKAQLKNFQNSDRYSSVNYIEHIQPYFSYILNGISDIDGNITFGMINDSKPEEVISKTFLIPLLELTYDFISLYNDDSIKETRETLDFLLYLIRQTNESLESGELENFIPFTFDLFEKCKLLRPEKVFLQLSLYAIRESIEQPIGSPQLKYKNMQLEPLLNEIAGSENLPLIYQKESNLHLYFIPDLSETLLEKYLSKLEKYLYSIFYDKFHKNGEPVIRVIYMAENENIKEFEANLLCKDGKPEFPEPIAVLKKIDVINIDSYQLNFGSQVKDFLDSVSKIGIIGIINKELTCFDYDDKEQILSLASIINTIKERPWTDKKETIRTIEHYKKLVLDGDNSVLKMLLKTSQSEFDLKLAEIVCDKEIYRSNISDYSYLDKIIRDDSEAYDQFTASIGLIYLFENKSPDNSIIQLLKYVKEDYKFEVDKENPVKSVNYKNLLSILTKNQRALETHASDFDSESSFISSLRSFANLLLIEDKISDINGFFGYLMINKESHFIRTYHNALGSYLIPELSECLYHMSRLKDLDIDQLKLDLTSEIKSVETKLTEVRTSIVERLEELKTLLDETQNLSNYAEKLSRANKGIVLIKQILNGNNSYSVYLIIYSIIENFKTVISNSTTFLTQVETIIDDIDDQKSNVDEIQEEIDTIYEDVLSEKLLAFEYPKKRNDGYLWKKNFLQDNIKNREEYEKLFGESRNIYNPFTSPTIYPDKIKKFNECLITVYNKTQPAFSELLVKIKEIHKKAQDTKKIESYIEQLLNVTEE